MRICLDIRPLLDANRSGVGNYTAGLISALLDLPSSGFDGAREYVLFANAAGNRLPPDIPAGRIAAERRFLRFPNRLLNAGFALAGWPRIEDLAGGGAPPAQRRAQGPDIERAPMAGGADLSYFPNLNFFATKKPYIMTVHDLSFVRHPDAFSRRQKLWHAAVRPGRVLERAAAVVAVSGHTKSDIMEIYGIPAERIRVINPGVGPEFRPATEAEKIALRTKFGLNKPFFLSLGTLEPRKNIASIIAAFERLPGDAELAVAGGKGWLYRDIFRRAAASPAKNRIRFLDYVADADKPALYSAAIALVYPSLYEGFGIPPLEAMACGAPVIAGHASSLPEVVGAAGLLANPLDVSEIAEAMRAVADGPSLRLALSSAGIARAKKFSWKESAVRLSELIEETGKRK